MIIIRPANERGHFNHGWLDTFHSFSFGDYHDPAHMSFRSLRVINEDRVAAGAGFPMHPHRDMEILTWILAGGLEHKDSLGSGGVIRPGEIQRMTAGRGIVHAEMNASAAEPVHLLQIWILPERKGLAPGYEQKAIPAGELNDRLRLVASRDGRDGSVTIHQDADVHAARLSSGCEAGMGLRKGRGAWVQVAKGEIDLNGRRLQAGDGAAVEGEERLTLAARTEAEALVFDLA